MLRLILEQIMNGINRKVISNSRKVLWVKNRIRAEHIIKKLLIFKILSTDFLKCFQRRIFTFSIILFQ